MKELEIKNYKTLMKFFLEDENINDSLKNYVSEGIL